MATLQSRRRIVLAMQVRDVELLDQGAIVTLAEVAQEVRLKFYTTRVGGEAVLAALKQKQSKRPPIHVLLIDALKHFDVSVCRATLDEFREGGLEAHLHLQSSDGKNVTVEALDSDVVTIAIRAGAPLDVSEQVVAALGFCRGQLIDVGGYHLSVHVKGSGGPTVVLESGFGGGYVTWSKVQDDIAQSQQRAVTIGPA
jgi:bifunctional DNase/RNase